MDDPVARGHAFVPGDLWRAPSLFLQPQEQDSIFEALDTLSTRLDLPTTSDEAPHFVFNTDLPQFPGLDVVEDPHLAERDDKLPPIDEEGERLDVWNLDLTSVGLPQSSSLCTWEAFDGKSVANSQQTAFISEAGQSAFDAFDGATKKEGVLPQDYTLRALCNLVHGRSSTLFQWNEERRAFDVVLPDIAVAGTSQICTGSLITDMVEMGTSVVRLRTFGDMAYSRKSTFPAVVAMQNGIASVLASINEVLCTRLGGVRSLLQLQRLTVRPRQLLRVFTTLVESVRDCRTDESLISAISDRIHALSQTNYDFSAVFRAFMARISVPWLEKLSTDLGLCIITPTMADAPCTDDYTKETHTFLDDIDIDLIRETRVAVTLLRELQPDNPLLGVSLSVAESPLERVTDPNSSLQQTSESARLYEARIMRQLADKSTSKRIVSVELPTDWKHPKDEISKETYITSLEDLMSQDPDNVQRETSDELHGLVSVACRNDRAEDTVHGPDLSTCVSSTPFERVRPFVRSQHRLVNGILLRRLLRDHQLRQQLELQKQFQLLGSGDFVTRLATALFSLNVQSAERKRGVIPTGEIMGLRLGSSSEQRWPPASSELRLTLAGVLEESQGFQPVKSEIRGDEMGALSFAIRELSEEEIDRVLDVRSVHALDFLRLQYIPAPPVDAIITPEAVQQYDVVFRFLLTLLRQVHVVKSIPRRKSGGLGDAANKKIITFANETHHFVSVLVAHSMELGINAPWQALVQSIEQLEQALKDEDAAGEIGTKATVGIQGLRQMHETCLDRIRGRLLLKRKHTKLRLAIEAVFTAILKSAAVISGNGTMDESAFEEQYLLFQQACSHLREMLLQVVEKPPKAMSAAESEDADTIRTLLLKLDWNDFYT